MKLVKQPGAKVTHIARDLGIEQSVLRRWVSGARIAWTARPRVTPSARPRGRAVGASRMPSPVRRG
ncbi:MAG: hypothetical protein EOO23_00660 [Comamonadaceae bacterium]|nr:MAG: hypothetical protein EOO23_00660 [Comamonadaceae bacterium]